MRVELRITSGSRAGQRERFEKAVISIGRHPSNDLRFHPEQDPDVSSRHAELRVADARATIHDLNSTNGTFVNGQRVQGERALADGDVLSFGSDGPRVEFRVAAGAGAPGAPPRRDTMVRIAEAVAQQTGTLRQMILGLAVLVVVGVAAAYWIGHRESAQARAQIADLLRRNDSLSAEFEKTVGAMKGRVAGLDAALQGSKSESEQLRARVRSAMAGGNASDLGELASQLDEAENRQRSLMSATSVNYEQIAAKNQPAMVFIAVKQANGELVSGTGFNVSPSGFVVTNRHVVQDQQGRPAKEVAVIFEGCRGCWKPSHVVKVSATDELAFIKIDVPGSYPVVQGVARDADVRVGSPVAMIGYPLGTSTAGMGDDIDRLLPVSSLGVATVSKLLTDTVQLDAFAAQGSSGSPVFNARGYVVGVVFGGQAESGGRIVYAVPSSKLVAQMPPEGARSIR